jgi:hypothetical protein
MLRRSGGIVNWGAAQLHGWELRLTLDIGTSKTGDSRPCKLLHWSGKRTQGESGCFVIQLRESVSRGATRFC